MNRELITTLYAQAVDFCVEQGPNPDGTNKAWLWEEKFVELVVKECVAQIQPMWDRVQKSGPPGGYDYDTFDLAYNDCMNAISEHFGVE